MPAPFEGGCRCGGVRYECSAEPVMVGHCHCRDCQYASGGGFSTIVLVPRASLSIEGDTAPFSVMAENGGDVTRRFCPTCGTPVFSEPASLPDLVVIKAGTLDDPGWLAPGLHLWTDSAQPWSVIPDGAITCAKNPQG